MRFTTSIKQIWAITKKELHLEARYLIPFFSNVFFNPLKMAVWFFIVYFGFFSNGATSLGDLNKDNYVLFLTIGSTFNMFFTIATSNFPTKFFNEKYWKTIQGFIIAPLNNFKFVIGLSLAELIKASFGVFVFSSIAMIFFPISIYKFLLVLAVIIFVFIGIMFIGLIRAAYILVNENINTVFEYAFMGVGFISCFYYPIQAFPKFLQPVIYYNPVYQGISLVRNIWIDQPIQAFSIIYVVAFTLFAVIFGSATFRRLIHHHDIEGY